MSESVRLLLSVAATEDMEVASLDVKTAFLYGLIPLAQFIYMRRPAGLTDVDMPAVIRLRKCIYGLPHALATLGNTATAICAALVSRLLLAIHATTCAYWPTAQRLM